MKTLSVTAALVLATGIVAASEVRARVVSVASAYRASDTIRSRAYADPGARRLVRRARAARHRRDTLLESHAVTWRERFYIGLQAERLRRERGLIHQQRAARIRWGRDGVRVVRWLGARRQSPIPNSRVNLVGDFDFVDPATDQIFLGSDWALHPLADTADQHYRYRSGDTLRIEVAGRTLTLVEIEVEPGERRFDRITGSLWFQEDTGVLARAAYRPARSFDLERDEPEDAGEVPRPMRPLRATVEYAVLDYGLQELTWWLPRRMAFRGRVQVGNLVGVPFRAEWSFEDYVVNEPVALDPGDDLPTGWRRVVRSRTADSVRTVEIEGGDTVSVSVAERSGGDPEGADGAEGGKDEREEGGEETSGDAGPATTEWRELVVVVPPPDSLRSSPELPPPFGRGDLAFGPGELSRLRREIPAPDAPAARTAEPELLWGASLTRYNRVEALSTGVGARLPLGGSTDLGGEVRLGVADRVPNAELRLRHRSREGNLTLGLYRRLQPAGDWGVPLGLGNSLNTLLLGYDDGLYYRARGAELELEETAGPIRFSAAVFGERQGEADRETNVSLAGAFGDDLRPNIGADEGTVTGLRGEFRVQGGIAATEPVVSGRVWGEAAVGDFDYSRLGASVALSTASADRWTLGAEVASGVATGSPPRQRRWFVGGSYSLRGFPAGALEGEAFWMSRAELARGIGTRPAGAAAGAGQLARIVAFADAAWAGARRDFASEASAVGVGLGVSLLDGLFRADLARGVHGGDDWRVHLYMDGIL